MSSAVTKQDIETALPSTGRSTWRDPDYPGLEMLGTRKGGAWYLRHRVDGKRVRDKLGRWPDLTVTGARKAAATLVEGGALKSAAGGDVLAERRANKEAKAKRRTAMTLAQTLDLYSADRLASLRSGDHAESVLRRVYAGVLPKSLADLTKTDLIACTDARRTNAPSAAEQAIRYAKPFLPSVGMATIYWPV